MPLAFGLAALIIRELGIWRRLVPIVVFVGYLVVPIIVVAVVLIVGLLGFKDEGRPLYDFARRATFFHWGLFGSIAWSLLGIASLFRNKYSVAKKLSGFEDY